MPYLPFEKLPCESIVNINIARNGSVAQVREDQKLYFK